MTERDYVLGTHDVEIERLLLQHRVWRPRALDAWRRGGFTTGQTLLDVGCGPGHATMDLAGITGPSGRVVAVDRSRRFLDTLETSCRRLGVSQVEAHEADLDHAELPVSGADGAWARWIFCFVRRPRELLERVARALRPGGVFVAHEYFDYSTWRLSPRSPELEEFVQAVMASWRENGGEPDIGLDLPRWLAELDFDVRHVGSIVDLVSPRNFVWQWPAAFVRGGVDRLVQLGRLGASRAGDIVEAVGAAEAKAETIMVTPAVAEVIAVRR